MDVFSEEVAKLERSKIRSAQADLLMQAVLALENEEEAYCFFEDLCTIAELKSMAQRLEVAVQLRQGVTYQEIAKAGGVSTATISRVNRALNYGADGYARFVRAKRIAATAPTQIIAARPTSARIAKTRRPSRWTAERAGSRTGGSRTIMGECAERGAGF